MFTVKDQFGFVVAICNNFDNAVKAAHRFTNKNIYVGKSATIYDADGLDIYKTTISAIED